MGRGRRPPYPGRSLISGKISQLARNRQFEAWSLRKAWGIVFHARRCLMPKYIIEREFPGAGKLSERELQEISLKSCDVLRGLGPEVQWLESFVTGDKIYCVYIAPSEDLVREHAVRGGFPANRVSEVKTIIDPTTAERLPQRAVA
jgi:hypothetical protein